MAASEWRGAEAQRRPGAGAGLEGPAGMIFSAVVFGFFGFFLHWNTVGVVSGQTLVFMVLWLWTLRGGAVAFGVAAGLTFVAPFMANLLYAVAGAASAVLFVVIAVLDLLDNQHTIFAYAPAVLMLFACWNAYGSFVGLRAAWSAGPAPEIAGGGE